MNLVRVAGGWALETGARISRELLADAFELVGRTDDALQAKTNPFEMPAFGVEDLAAAEQSSSQRLDRARIPVAGRVHPARGAPQVFRAAD
jgi:hypothetical protein